MRVQLQHSTGVQLEIIEVKKMKKILIGLFAIVLMATFVTALSMPHPIYGFTENDGIPLRNLEVRVEHILSGVYEISHTNNDGFFQVDLGNLGISFRDGDGVKVSLIYCQELSRCSKTVTLSGGGNEVSFDLAKELLPEAPDTVIIVNYICWNGDAVESQDDCPPVIVPVIQIECADGTIVEDKSDCPEESSSWIAWVIGLLVAFLAGAGGLKFYNGKLKHYHRGYSYYHDPSTRHSKLPYRHRLWKESALGCIKDVKKIQQGIDLSK